MAQEPGSVVPSFKVEYPGPWLCWSLGSQRSYKGSNLDPGGPEPGKLSVDLGTRVALGWGLPITWNCIKPVVHRGSSGS